MKKTLYIILCSLPSVAQAQVDLKKGLMLYLPFNGNTLDVSPNGNHATNYGATLTSDQWGRANSAYYFDGSTNYMRIPNSPTLQPNTQITLSARVNVKGFYSGPCYNNSIIDKAETDYLPGNYTLRFNAASTDCYDGDTNKCNYLGYFYDQGPLGTTAVTTPHVTKGNWDCLIFTYDGAMANMYVNGVLRHQYASSSVIGSNVHDVFLGHKNLSTHPYWFNGVMDEVRIYNRALNTDEIDSLCSNSQPLSIIETEQQQLPVWQNPVDQELNIVLNDEKLRGTLHLVDICGKVVLRIESLTTTSLPLNGIPPGLYMVTYHVEDQFMRAKILKR